MQSIVLFLLIGQWLQLECSTLLTLIFRLLQDILRCWVRLHPVSSKRLLEGSVACIILSKQPAFEANFSLHPDANPKSRTSGLVRWQMNPEKDWGPKPRATRAVNAQSVDNRRAKGESKAQTMRQKRKAEVIKFILTFMIIYLI